MDAETVDWRYCPGEQSWNGKHKKTCEEVKKSGETVAEDPLHR